MKVKTLNSQASQNISQFYTALKTSGGPRLESLQVTEWSLQLSVVLCTSSLFFSVNILCVDSVCCTVLSETKVKVIVQVRFCSGVS